MLVGLLIASRYSARVDGGQARPEQVLYQWSTAVGGLVQDAIVLVLVLAIAGFSRALLALRRPRPRWRRARCVGVAIVAIYVFEVVYGALVRPRATSRA